MKDKMKFLSIMVALFLIVSIFPVTFAQEEFNTKEYTSNEILKFAEEAANNEITKLNKQIKQLKTQNKKGKVKKNQQKIEEIKAQIETGDFNEEILEEAKVLYDKYLETEKRTNEIIAGAQKTIEKLESAETLDEIIEKFDNKIKNFNKNINTLKKSSAYNYKKITKNAVKDLGIEKEYIENYFNNNYLEYKLEKLELKEKEIKEYIKSVNTNKKMRGRQKSAIIEIQHRKLDKLKPQIADAKLQLKRLEALKKGLSEEELLSMGLSKSQIKHFVDVEKSNAKASIRQDQLAKQPKIQKESQNEKECNAYNKINGVCNLENTNPQADFGPKYYKTEDNEPLEGSLSAKETNNGGEIISSSLPGSVGDIIIIKPTKEESEEIIEKITEYIKENDKTINDDADLMEILTNAKKENNLLSIFENLEKEELFTISQIPLEEIEADNSELAKTVWESVIGGWQQDRSTESVIIDIATPGIIATGAGIVTLIIVESNPFAAAATVFAITYNTIDTGQDLRDIAAEITSGNFNAASFIPYLIPLGDEVKKVSKIGSKFTLSEAAKLLAKNGHKILNKKNVKDISYTRSQVGSKLFSHSPDFGMTLSKDKQHVTPEKIDEFIGLLKKHVDDKDTIIVKGKFRDEVGEFTHYYNTKTGNVLIQQPDGEFRSAYKLNSEEKQRRFLTEAHIGKSK